MNWNEVSIHTAIQHHLITGQGLSGGGWALLVDAHLG
jgi:hypothetical protein